VSKRLVQTSGTPVVPVSTFVVVVVSFAFAVLLVVVVSFWPSLSLQPRF